MEVTGTDPRPKARAGPFSTALVDDTGSLHPGRLSYTALLSVPMFSAPTGLEKPCTPTAATAGQHPVPG